MPLSLAQHSFGAASGDCVNICNDYHFGSGHFASMTGPG